MEKIKPYLGEHIEDDSSHSSFEQTMAKFHRIEIVGGGAVGLTVALKLDKKLQNHHLNLPIRVYEKRVDEKRIHIVTLAFAQQNFLGVDFCIQALQYGWFSKAYGKKKASALAISYKKVVTVLQDMIKQSQHSNVEIIHQEILPTHEFGPNSLVIAAHGSKSKFRPPLAAELAKPEAWAAMVLFKFNDGYSEPRELFTIHPNKRSYRVLNNSPQRDETQKNNFVYQLTETEYGAAVGSFKEKKSWNELPSEFQKMIEYSFGGTSEEFHKKVDVSSIEFWRYEITLRHATIYVDIDNDANIVTLVVGDAAMTHHNFGGIGLNTGIEQIIEMLKSMDLNDFQEFERYMQKLTADDAPHGHTIQRKRQIEPFTDLVEHCTTESTNAFEICMSFERQKGRKHDGLGHTLPFIDIRQHTDRPRRLLLSDVAYAESTCPIPNDSLFDNFSIAVVVGSILVILIVAFIGFICRRQRVSSNGRRSSTWDRLRASFTRGHV